MQTQSFHPNMEQSKRPNTAALKSKLGKRKGILHSMDFYLLALLNRPQARNWVHMYASTAIFGYLFFSQYLSVLFT